MLNIIPFESIHAQIFKNLNIEWLEAFFVVEPYDELVLSNPETEILNKNGFIFMTANENEIIGTFAFLKKGERLYEFSKMAVTPNERGKGYGNQIIQFAIHFAEQHKWEKIILYSSTILENSIYLYRKYGFTEIPIELDAQYARGNIKMELVL
jgi:N-acetylglutamate synthase-like GNAT family acetyltransferase